MSIPGTNHREKFNIKTSSDKDKLEPQGIVKMIEKISSESGLAKRIFSKSSGLLAKILEFNQPEGGYTNGRLQAIETAVKNKREEIRTGERRIWKVMFSEVAGSVTYDYTMKKIAELEKIGKTEESGFDSVEKTEEFGFDDIYKKSEEFSTAHPSNSPKKTILLGRISKIFGRQEEKYKSSSR